MSSRRPGTIASTLSIFLIALTGHGLAMAQTTAAPVQVLDTVALFGQDAAGGLAQEVVFPESGSPFLEDTAAREAGATYQACKLTSGRGLFCLDGNTVKRWSNPEKGPAVPVLRCDDTVGLTACTGMTVDIAGNIWLAGKNKGKTHTLVKVSENGCGSDAVEGSHSFLGLDFDKEGNPKEYCASPWASDRPLLEDITAVDGDVGAQFPGGPGILGLQERTRVFYFPFGPVSNDDPPKPPAPVEIASGKNSWNLSGGERLQSVTVWQPAPDQNLVLATSSTGKIRIKDLANPSITSEQLIPGAVSDRNAFYGIRSSSKSGLVYVTDRTGQRLQVLDPSDGWSLTYTIGTAPLSPTGPTVAAGVSVDLSKCTINQATGKCESTVTPGATLLNANGALAPGASGVTIFQVKDIPDCRWVDAPACQSATEPVIFGPDGATAADFDSTHEEASRQYLNVTPLLPAEVTDLFPEGTLPALLISPQYRGQVGRDTQLDYYFDAFFAIPEEGVVFTGTFEGEYDVGQLVDPDHPEPNELGCDGTFGLEWDVLTRVSEKFRSVGDRYVDTLINTGCGSSLGSKFGFSLIPYNLAITPDTWIKVDPEEVDSWIHVPANDAVFGRLLQQLYGELSEVLSEYACVQQDNLDDLGAPPPISTATCDILKSQLANAGDKLDKCILATYQPKQSSGNQNCQSFETQFTSFRNLVDQMRATEQCPGSTASEPVYDCDIANRKSELYVRAKVIQHVYDTRFVPSIPIGGFCREAEVLETGSCPTAP